MSPADLLSLQTKIDSLTASIRDLESQSAPVAARLIDPFLSLPGLVGFWPMSSVQRSTGNAYDLSGQGRTLTYNGNPTYNIFNGFAPYIDLDGTGDFLSRADETDLDILGTETIYASAVRGLTLGGWGWFDNAAGSIETLMGKFGAAGNYSYLLQRNGAGNLDWNVSSNGTALTSVTGSALAASGWYFFAARYTPSMSVSVFQNMVEAVNSTSIPSALFNSTADFRIGLRSDGNFPMDGRAALCFLCANAVSNAKLTEVFNATRRYFGV